MNCIKSTATPSGVLIGSSSSGFPLVGLPFFGAFFGSTVLSGMADLGVVDGVGLGVDDWELRLVI